MERESSEEFAKKQNERVSEQLRQLGYDDEMRKPGEQSAEEFAKEQNERVSELWRQLGYPDL